MMLVAVQASKMGVRAWDPGVRFDGLLSEGLFRSLGCRVSGFRAYLNPK